MPEASTPLESDLRARARRALAPALRALALVAIGAFFGLCEARTSWLQSTVATRIAARATFRVEPGAGAAIPFSSAGPYDVRLGYTRLPEFRERLLARGFRIEAQARMSPTMRNLVRLGLPPIGREPPAGALRLEDQRGELLFDAREPPGYADFDSIPPLVAQSLLFVENRELLHAVYPRRNPVLEWDRLGSAAAQYAREQLRLGAGAAGGSTLAIQIEKFRHSPRGLTDSPLQKLRQIAAATLRAYRYGPDTRAVRRELVVDYLNSLPLAAVPGHGEVLGLRGGLAAWFGADFDETNARLRAIPASGPVADADALAYAEVLSLILATQRPTAYLGGGPALLAARRASYLGLLEGAGVISPELRAAVGHAQLPARPVQRTSLELTLERKPAGPIRTRLVELLGLAAYPELDDLDLRVESTLDRRSQLRASTLLHELTDPRRAAALGLTGFRLLAPGEGAGVVWSFSLYERGLGANRLLVQTDNSPSALDVSEGAKLDLGSTAKLRTLVSYLEALATLYDRLAPRPAAELRALPVHPKDRLARWTRDTLVAKPGIGLAAFLDEALARKYSASPGEAFFTGGGLHHFANFHPEDNARIPTVREAFRDSINLPFVRLMRDLVDHLIFRAPGGARSVLENLSDPRRASYLSRFADRESKTYLRRFYQRYRGLPPDAALARLLEARPPTPKRVAVVLRSVESEATFESFAAEMKRRLGARTPPSATLEAFYATYAPDRLGLSDRGALAGVHPLELWLAGYLRAHPDATLDQLFEASGAERVEVYRWLFRRAKSAQDRRIRTELEREAFQEIHAQWRATGYPFESLTPSYATAIGSSGDRPSALAELVGLLLNDGVRQPTRRLERIAFGEGTAWETRFVPAPRAARRVVRSEVASAVRGALRDVVTAGTARRAEGALVGPGGRVLAISGKTGTGDHRYKVFGAGGRLLESRAVSRSATFVFTVEDRFYGVATAHVAGPAADRYHFTSSLPVQLFREIAPSIIGPLMGQQDPAASESAPLSRGEHGETTLLPFI